MLGRLSDKYNAAEWLSPIIKEFDINKLRDDKIT